MIRCVAQSPGYRPLLQWKRMANRTGYTETHAKAGLDHKFPEIDTWPNQFPAYEILIDVPEFTSVCPKTGLPDFGPLEIRYRPDKLSLQLKPPKESLLAHRNPPLSHTPPPTHLLHVHAPPPTPPP